MVRKYSRREVAKPEKDCPSSVSTASTEPKVASAEFVYLKN